MDIDLLGPLSARLDGHSITPSAAKPRAVFTMLAMHADETVSVGALQEELWGARIPRSAGTTLQTYVLQLRHRIGDALSDAPPGTDRDPKNILVTQPGGYLLDTQGGAVDVLQFERFADAGHRAHERGDYALASEQYRRALALWKGDALCDVPVGQVLEVELARLGEMRLSVLDRRIDADLRLGRHHELLGEVTALVARNRTHEGLCAHLMLALHRAGRRGEAVNTYRTLRNNLVREIGLEPSPVLHQLQRMILTADPRLSLRGTGAGPMAAVPQLAHAG